MMNATVFPERNRLAVNAVKLASRVFLTPFFKINVRGIENIPEKGSFVLLPKHQRWEDIPLIAISVRRALYYVAKQELFDNFFSKKFIAMLGGLPLNRRRPARSRYTFSSVLRKLHEEEGVVIFPEGTYYRNHMGPAQTGLIRMVHSNIQTVFIPAGITYGSNPVRKTVKISFGNPLKSDMFGSSKELKSVIMNEIAELSGMDIL